MKKYWIIGIIVIIILGGLYMLIFNKNVEIKNVNHFVFSYDVNNMMNGNVRYQFDVKDGKYLVEIKPYEVADEDTLKIEADESFKEELEKILIQYEVGKWNGFKKYDKNVLDGHSFSLSVKIGDDTWLSANGYMKWPKNYKEVRNSLDSLFMQIYNENKEE